MKLALFFLLNTCLFGLLGCTQLQSKEEQCLQSAKLTFKDPDSGKVIQNLGDRGMKSGKGEKMFWLRYSATNSYGARVSSNMACKKSGEAWVRDELFETLSSQVASLKLQKQLIDSSNEKLRANIAAIKACKTQACKRDLNAQGDSFDITSGTRLTMLAAEADKSVQRIIFDETGSLEKYE